MTTPIPVPAAGRFPFVPPLPLHPTEILPPEVRLNPRAGMRILRPAVHDDLGRMLEEGEAQIYKDAGVFGFSPSQIDNYRDCARWWGFRSIERAPEPEKFSSNLGSECHSHWEDYLRDGKAPPTGTLAGKIAKSTLRFLPLPGVARVEGETKMWTPLGIFTTRIDFEIEDQGMFELAALGEAHPTWDQSLPLFGVPLVGDHKTTSDIDQYAKHPEDLIGDGTEELPGDAQATGYSLIEHTKYGASEIDLFWSYAATKGRARAHPVRARHTLETLDRALRFFWRDVAQMRYWKENTKKANDLPPNPHACDKYGGCPHRSRCAITNEQRNTAFMSNETGNLAALLGLGGAAPAAPATSTVSAPPPATPAPVGGLLGAKPVLPAGGGLLGSKPATPPPAAAPTTPAPVGGLLGGLVPAPAAELSPEVREQGRKLAASLFAQGRTPPPTARPDVLEAYAELVAKAAVNPPDAAPATGPLLGVPPPAVLSTPAPKNPPIADEPEKAAAVAAVVDEVKAKEAAAETEAAANKGKGKGGKSKSKAAEGAAPAGDLAAFTSVQLLEEVLARNLAAKQYATVSTIAKFLENAVDAGAVA